jgi:hypothetical protein
MDFFISNLIPSTFIFFVSSSYHNISFISQPSNPLALLPPLPHPIHIHISIPQFTRPFSPYRTNHPRKNLRQDEERVYPMRMHASEIQPHPIIRNIINAPTSDKNTAKGTKPKGKKRD